MGPTHTTQEISCSTEKSYWLDHATWAKENYLSRNVNYKTIKHDKLLENYSPQVNDMTKTIGFVIGFVSLHIIFSLSIIEVDRYH